MSAPEIVAVCIDDLPLQTYVGVKYEETVDVKQVGCENCPFLEDCRVDVMEHNGFAWCEEAIPVDLDPSYRTVGRAR